MGKVASIAAKRFEKERERHRKNRLMMLMHSFMDAAEKDDEPGMKMVGRGLSGYTKTEINEANRVAKRQRMKPQPQPPKAS